jgi:hypothetical protein
MSGETIYKTFRRGYEKNGRSKKMLSSRAQRDALDLARAVRQSTHSPACIRCVCDGYP